MNTPEQALLFETVKIHCGEIIHHVYHNERMNRSRYELFGSTNRLDLREIIDPVPHGFLRCRVSYGEEIHAVEYFPYVMRKFQSFRILERDISYDYKYLNRNDIDRLFNSRDSADDVIIIRQGLVTDTSIANIAFHEGDRWITPAHPLLRGTTRQRYLDSGLLVERSITVDDTLHFSKMALLNAMLDFHIIENPRFIR
ncbi:MAG: hypothetical protein CVV44_07600 [Spirochaetae bacterium HGW-Spirochaetae-1]|jgi:4-amino-4-deoxychorismate lyase|nr:MAG: hypothetical protein CVV44_07600 [Spirochaetae bacterium HGW-Spirochaetae-1]